MGRVQATNPRSRTAPRRRLPRHLFVVPEQRASEGRMRRATAASPKKGKTRALIPGAPKRNVLDLGHLPSRSGIGGHRDFADHTRRISGPATRIGSANG